MLHVLKCLISNALKFTPSGGFIDISANIIERDLAYEGAKRTYGSVIIPSREFLQIAIKDNGVGMTSSEISEVFDESAIFRRRARKNRGTGFSLWTASQIVKRHGGTITASSEGLNTGSIFVIEIPCDKIPTFRQEVNDKPRNDNNYDSISPHAIEDLEEAYSGLRESFIEDRNLFKVPPLVAVGVDNVHRYIQMKGISSLDLVSMEQCQHSIEQQLQLQQREEEEMEDPHVKYSELSILESTSIRSDNKAEGMDLLIVDDSMLNRKMMVKLLESRGHKTDEADDGDTAVDILKIRLEEGRPYDVILLDNEMPRMRGVEAARAMRLMGYEGLIFGVTGNTLQSDVNEFKLSGVDCVIPKPLTHAAFTKACEEHLFRNEALIKVSNDSPILKQVSKIMSFSTMRVSLESTVLGSKTSDAEDLKSNSFLTRGLMN